MDLAKLKAAIEQVLLWDVETIDNTTDYTTNMGERVRRIKKFNALREALEELPSK